MQNIAIIDQNIMKLNAIRKILKPLNHLVIYDYKDTL